MEREGVGGVKRVVWWWWVSPPINPHHTPPYIHTHTPPHHAISTSRYLQTPSSPTSHPYTDQHTRTAMHMIRDMVVR